MSVIPRIGMLCFLFSPVGLFSLARTSENVIAATPAPLPIKTASVDGQVSSTETAEQPQGNASPRELSVAPLDHIEYPESRPAWVSSLPDSEGETFRTVVVAGPCETPEQCLEERRVMQRAAVSALAGQIVGTEGSVDFYSPGDEEIERDLVVRKYSGKVTQGDQTRYEQAVEIEFSKAAQERVLEAWSNVEVGRRLGLLGAATGSGLVLLMIGSVLTGMFSRHAERREAREAKDESIST